MSSDLRLIAGLYQATRDQAEQMCQEMGLELVSLETAEENELIKEIFHATPIGQSGVRMWTSGTKERVDASRTPLLVLMLSLPPNEHGLKEKIKEIIRQQEQDDYKFWTWSSTGTRLNYTDWRPDDHQITIGKDENLALWYNIKGTSGWKNIITPAEDQPHYPLCEVPASVVAESLASLN